MLNCFAGMNCSISLICHFRKDDMRQFWTRFWHRRYGNCYTFNKGIDENGLDTEIMTTSQAGRGELNITKSVIRLVKYFCEFF